jgi:energy-coupling factor transporter ATP-binding protein EcfA2
VALDDAFTRDLTYAADFADIMGQEHVKRAMDVAAAGGHNVLMSGPPGAGKTLIAKSLPGILPRMSIDEALEVTKIYSVANQLPAAPLRSCSAFRRVFMQGPAFRQTADLWSMRHACCRAERNGICSSRPRSQTLRHEYSPPAVPTITGPTGPLPETCCLRASASAKPAST